MSTGDEDEQETYETLYGGKGTVERVVNKVQTSLTLLTAVAGVLLVVVGALMEEGTIAGLVAIYGFGAIVLGLLGYGSIWALQRL